MISVRTEPFFIVMEYAEHGSLKDFLKKYKINNCSLPFTGELLTSKDLVSFALQIARGMQHLAARHFIHRDLAARNVLVTSDLRMKIADFGLSRTTGDSEYYRKSRDYVVPVKWLAPECLKKSGGLYSVQSDVSFGCFLVRSCDSHVIHWIALYHNQCHSNPLSACQ